MTHAVYAAIKRRALAGDHRAMVWLIRHMR
jgi:hypothetical protein